MATGPQQGPQSDQECQEAEAQPGTWAPTKHTEVVQVGEGQGPRVVRFAPHEGQLSRRS